MTRMAASVFQPPNFLDQGVNFGDHHSVNQRQRAEEQINAWNQEVQVKDATIEAETAVAVANAKAPGIRAGGNQAWGSAMGGALKSGLGGIGGAMATNFKNTGSLFG